MVVRMMRLNALSRRSVVGRSVARRGWPGYSPARVRCPACSRWRGPHRRLAAASDHDREILQRQIDATDREIDRLVYELYGLSDEEVAIVEGRA